MRAGRVVVAIGLFGFGFVTGFHAVFVHRNQVLLGGVEVPYGLLLALLATCVGSWLSSRLLAGGAVCFAAGWFALVVAQQTVRPGSYLIASDGLGWSFLILGMGCLVVVVLRTRTTKSRSTH